jgi:hypothetical protein
VPRSGGDRAGARGAGADRGGGRSVGVLGTAGCGRGRCRRGQRCGVTAWGELATAGRSLRGCGVLARRERGGMGPGISAWTSFAPPPPKESAPRRVTPPGARSVTQTSCRRSTGGPRTTGCARTSPSVCAIRRA